MRKKERKMKNYLKKYIAVLLAALMLLLPTACQTRQAAEPYGQQTSLSEAQSPSRQSPEAAPVSQDESSSSQTGSAGSGRESGPQTEPAPEGPDVDGYYYAVEDVVNYIDAYGELPENFITKKEARELGWEGGSVERYLEGAAIGGDSYGNREGLLPKGHKYIECDIDTDGQNSRGAKRLVFSYDGLYFYTDDHYESFRELWVTEGGEVEWR